MLNLGMRWASGHLIALTTCQRYRATPARMSMMRTYLSDTRRRHSPKFYYMGRSGIFMMPSVINQALLAQEQGRSEKAGRDLRAADTSTSSPKKTRENATMVIAVDARHAMRQGVTFYRRQEDEREGHALSPLATRSRTRKRTKCRSAGTGQSWRTGEHCPWPPSKKQSWTCWWCSQRRDV